MLLLQTNRPPCHRPPDRLNRLSEVTLSHNGAPSVIMGRRRPRRLSPRQGGINGLENGLIDDITLIYSGNQLLYADDAAPEHNYSKSLDFRAKEPEYVTFVHSWWNPFNWGRNIEILIGKIVAGEGIGYYIYLYGEAKLKPILPWIK